VSEAITPGRVVTRQKKQTLPGDKVYYRTKTDSVRGLAQHDKDKGNV
jgi:hypothetical protein